MDDRGMSLRSVAVRVLALVWALAALTFPGFGLIDLSVSWDASWPVMLEAGWGLFFTVFVGWPFIMISVAPRARTAPFVQLLLSVASLLIAGIMSAEPPALTTAVVVTLTVLSVRSAAPRMRWRRPPVRPSAAFLALSAAGVVPAALYSWDMAARNRRVGGLDVTMGVDHYAVQAALAVAIVAATSVAAGWPSGRRLLGFSAGISAGYLGLVSYNWPATAGAVGSAWSIATVIWGGLALVASALPHRSPASSRDQTQST
jgi:hypothetical protein